MADNLGGGPTINVNVDADGDSLAEVLGQIVDNFGDELNALTRKFSRDLKSAFGGGGGAAETFGKQGARSVNRVAEAIHDLTKNIHATDSATRGFGRSLDNALDPASFDGFKAALEEIFRLQAKLDLGPGVLGEEAFRNIETELKLRNAALLAQRVALSNTQKAANEEAANRERNARQVSRTEIQESRAATSRFVVDAQTQAAAARDAARKRVAYVQAATRVIATLERGLSNLFRQTARVFSSAFRSAATTVSGIANGIGRAFTRTTTNIRNSVTNSNSEVSRSYRKTFGDTTNTVQNETRKQQSIINNFAREASSSIGSIRTGAGLGLGAAIGGILGVGAARALQGGFQRATTLENSERALTKLLSSAERAKALLTEVTDVVTGTPFRLDQFAQGATQLLAFNVEAEKIPEVLRTIADASALSLDPDQTVDRLIRTFGQISAAGKLTTEDLNQLTEAGVPAWALLGNQIGKTVPEMRKLVEDGAIPATQAIELLLNGIQNGTEGVNDSTVAFAGLSKELGGTLKGSLANFNTAISRLGANVITAFQKPLVAALGAGTAAIDLIGSALKQLAIAVQESLVVQTLQRALEGLAATLKNAKNAAQPFFEFLAGGAALFAQVAAGLFVFRRIPAILGAIAQAVRVVLAPTNLLIAAGVLIAGFFQNLFSRSRSLRDALANLGDALGRVATTIRDIVRDSFDALSGEVSTGTEIVGGFAEKVVNVVVPALEALTGFIDTKVLPLLRRFAEFMRTTVVPAVGRRIVQGVEIGKAALGKLLDFIRGPVAKVFGEFVNFVRVAFEIITQGGTTLSADGWLGYNGPVVKGLFAIRKLLKQVAEFFRAAVTILWKGDEYTKGTGWLSEDGLVIRGLERIRSTMESLVDFVGNNLVPTLAGVGGALGVFALSGSLPLAGLVGLTVGIAAALSKKSIRDALVKNISEGIDRAKDLWDDFIDSGVLEKVGVGVLKVTRKIGEVLGTIVSDPRFIAALGAIAAAAVALAGSFILGLLQGIESNLGDLTRGLIRLLSKAFQFAVSESVKDPKLGALLVGLIAGPLIIRKLVAGAKRTGAITAESFGTGFAANANIAGVGNTTSAFFRTLTGGPAAIQKIGAQAGDTYAKAFATRIRRNNDLIKAIRGTNFQNPLGLDPEQGARGRFTGRLAPTEANLRKQENELRTLATTYGKASVAGATFRLGLQQIGRSLTTEGRSLTTFKDGLANLGQGLRGASSQLGTSIGIIAGGAFAASFVGQALFDVESTGQQKLQSALGLVAVGAATGSQFGAKGAAVGAGIGALVAAYGFLTTKVDENAEAFKRAEEAVGNYAGALGNLKDLRDATDFLPAIGENLATTDVFSEGFRNALKDAPEVAATLDDIGFKFEQVEDFLNGRTTGGVFFAGVRNQLKGANIEGDQFNDTIEFIEDQLGGYRLAFETEASTRNIFSSTTLSAEETAGAVDVAKTATQAFKDKVAELNEARLDGFRSRVDEARTLLDEAGRAADTAKEKLRQFLSGETEEVGFQEQVNNAIIGVGNIAAGLDGLDLNLVKDKATFDNQVLEVQRQVGSLLADAPEGTDLVALLQPLRDSISEENLPTELATALQGGIDAALTAAQSQPGQSLFQTLFTQESLEADAAAEVERTKAALATALEQNPLDVPLILAAATQAFEDAGADSSAGYVEGFDTEEMAAVAKKGADDALAAARTALGIASPSLQFEIIGGFATLGFIKGLGNNLDLVEEAGASLKDAAIKGIDPETQGEYLAFLDAGRDSGYAFGDGTANVGVVASLYDRGRQLVKAVLHGIDPETDGEYLAFFDAGKNAGYAFASGLSRSKEVIAAAGRSAAKAASDAIKSELDINSPSKVMEDLGRGTMAGFAKGITESAALVSDAATGAVQGALDAANSDVNVNFSGGTAQSVASRYSATADTVPYGAANMKAMTDADIQSLARAIAAESKPNVQIDQTFNKPVDSRALATDVAWRLT